VPNGGGAYPEVLLQFECIKKIFESYIGRRRLGREIQVLVCDFIHDSSPGGGGDWKFLNLKFYHTVSSSIINSTSPFLVPFEKPRHKGVLKCAGDYCQLEQFMEFGGIHYQYLKEAVVLSSSHTQNQTEDSSEPVKKTDIPVVEDGLDCLDSENRFRIERKVIYFDRLRKREIIAGRLKDEPVYFNSRSNTPDIEGGMESKKHKNDLYNLKQRIRAHTMSGYDCALVCPACYKIYKFLEQQMHSLKPVTFHTV